MKYLLSLSIIFLAHLHALSAYGVGINGNSSCLNFTAEKIHSSITDYSTYSTSKGALYKSVLLKLFKDEEKDTFLYTAVKNMIGERQFELLLMQPIQFKKYPPKEGEKTHATMGITLKPLGLEDEKEDIFPTIFLRCTSSSKNGGFVHQCNSYKSTSSYAVENFTSTVTIVGDDEECGEITSDPDVKKGTRKTSVFYSVNVTRNDNHTQNILSQSLASMVGETLAPSFASSIDQDKFIKGFFENFYPEFFKSIK